MRAIASTPTGTGQTIQQLRGQQVASSAPSNATLAGSARATSSTAPYKPPRPKPPTKEQKAAEYAKLRQEKLEARDRELDVKRCIANGGKCRGWKTGGTDYCHPHAKKAAAGEAV